MRSLSAGCMSKGAEIKAVGRRARAAGKATALGGPSVSASPEKYPEFDYLHLGELGDATDELIRAIDEGCAGRPRRGSALPRESVWRSPSSRSRPIS